MDELLTLQETIDCKVEKDAAADWAEALDKELDRRGVCVVRVIDFITREAYRNG